MKRIAITFSVILYAFVVPFLEINESHVFNLDWTPHARIHEVWQLITNTGIGLYCIWLIWMKRETAISFVLSLLVTGGFLIAYFLRSGYGGSMKYLDGTEKTILGINIGLLGFGVAVLWMLFSVFADRRSPKRNR